MVDKEKIILMDQHRIERSLKRIAHQIAEHNREDKDLLLVGINIRGFAVAGAIKNYLAALYQSDIVCKQLQVEQDSGDLWKDIPDNKKYFTVLVDDVIFSGKTMFKALVQLSECLNPEEVHTAVLVDRGHRKLPVDAEFVGMELPTKLNEHVSVALSDKNKLQQVELLKS